MRAFAERLPTEVLAPQEKKEARRQLRDGLADRGADRTRGRAARRSVVGARRCSRRRRLGWTHDRRGRGAALVPRLSLHRLRHSRDRVRSVAQATTTPPIGRLAHTLAHTRGKALRRARGPRLDKLGVTSSRPPHLRNPLETGRFRLLSGFRRRARGENGNRMATATPCGRPASPVETEDSLIRPRATDRAAGCATPDRRDAGQPDGVDGVASCLWEVDVAALGRDKTISAGV